MEMTRVSYKCSCGGTDTVDIFPGDTAYPPALGCLKCRGGFNMPANDQAARRVGLLPVEITKYETEDTDGSVREQECASTYSET